MPTSPPPPDADRHRRLRALFESAAEMTGEVRAAYLQRECGGDGRLRADVERLLGLHEKTRLGFDQLQPQGVNVGQFLPGAVMPVGRRIAERFEVRRVLGEGGMGTVYEVADTALDGSALALKTIRADLGSDAGLLERFKREIQILRRVTHPNVCRVFDFFPAQNGEPAFFTMELLGGETLAARIRREGALDPEVARQILLDVLAGLEAAHAAGAVHRDLKPANIMLTERGGESRAVLMDFGIARGTDAGDASGLTSAGAAIGTPMYMAPEQMEGTGITVAVDIYACGVIALEMLTGAAPFDGKTPLAIVSRKLGPEPVRAGQLADLEPAWQALILRCLERRPEERFASVAAMRQMLERDGLRDSLVWRVDRIRRAVSGSRRAALQAGAGVLLAGAIGTGGYVWWRSRPYEAKAEAQTWYERGLRSLVEGAVYKAYQQLTAAVQADAGYPAAAAARALAAQELDRQNAAQEMLLRFPVEQLWGLDKLRVEAARAFVLYQPEAARRAFRQLAERTSGVERLYARIGEAWTEERSGNPGQAVVLYRKILEQEKDQAGALLRLGVLLGRSGQREGLERLDAAGRVFGTSGDVEGQLRVALERAGVRQTGKDEQLLADTQAALAKALSLEGAVDLQVLARFRLAMLLKRAGQHAEAQQQIGEAITLGRQEGGGILAQGLGELVSAYGAQNRWADVAPVAREALGLSVAAGASLTAAWARRHLALALAWLHQFDEVDGLLEEAERFFSERGRWDGMLSVEYVRGIYWIEARRVPEAAKRAETAIATARRQGNFEAEALLWNIVNHADAEAGRLGRLLESYAGLSRVARQLQRPVVLTLNLLKAVEIHLNLGMWEEARRGLGEARQAMAGFAEEMTYFHFQVEMLEAMLALGERRYGDAVRHGEQALRYPKQVARPVRGTVSEALVAKALLLSGDANGAKRLEALVQKAAREQDARTEVIAVTEWIEGALLLGDWSTVVRLGVAHGDAIRKHPVQLRAAEALWRIGAAKEKSGREGKQEQEEARRMLEKAMEGWPAQMRGALWKRLAG